MSRKDSTPGTTGLENELLGLPRGAAAEVRGHLALHAPAPMALRAVTLSADLAAAWAVTVLTIHARHANPSPSLAWAPLVALALGLVWCGLKLVTGRSLGELFWGLQPEPRRGAGFWLRRFAILRQDVYRYQGRSGVGRLALVLTGASWLAAALLTWNLCASHPLWLAGRTETLAAAAPDATDGETWAPLPFFYSLGAWPRTFNGHPVFHTLPYEKGPPQRFPGHVVARWRMPDAQVTFEGPKTPPALLALASGPATGDAEASATELREALRRCVGEGAGSALDVLVHPRCWSIRRAALERHLDEMTARVHPEKWGLSWLKVDAPGALARGDARSPSATAPLVEGIWLEAVGRTRGQDRFIMVTHRGTHQAFVLDYPRDEAGERARSLFRKAIRALRASDDLLAARAWADRGVQEIDLSRIEAAADRGEQLRRLADVQAALISKVTVDPRTFESYFHLGGTSILLARLARSAQPDDAADADWKAVSKPLLSSALRFARDVAPQDPRTTRLQDLWLEAEKY